MEFARQGNSKQELKMRMKRALVAGLTAAALLVTAPASAQQSAEQAYAEIEGMFGFVPSYLKAYPRHAVAAAWALTRDLEVSDTTALSPKVKALINIAVAAQIPCQYCIFADTQNAKAFGATDEEIGEAVAQAALTRHWSTILNGLQVDLDAFKSEFE